MQTTLCSFVCCCYWNMGIDLLYWVEGMQINITVAMYNLHVVQITDLNLNVQTKQELKKKLNRSLTYKQWINQCSTVAYTLNLQILFGLHEQIHCRIFEQKVRYIVYLLIWNDFLTSNSWYNSYCRCLLICILTL